MGEGAQRISPPEKNSASRPSPVKVRRKQALTVPYWKYSYQPEARRIPSTFLPGRSKPVSR